MLAGQLLRASWPVHDPLYFWVRDDPRANAEIDFLVPVGGAPQPVEVKAGATGALKSLHQYLHRSGRRTGFRLAASPTRIDDLSVRMPDGDMKYRLVTIPIYLAELFLESADRFL